ncbi:MAG: hypothetical protein CVU29_07235 [Betaproteobacteria bacterium HGW-Betaproteobacteria-22]|nr:MAG: hypothetical protein CVU29_07235 [Betaproteobacteria bacterium HGW-Betaproteobacteria-22]
MVADFDASGFDASDLLAKLQVLLSGLLPHQSSSGHPVGFIYGSGFEAQPALLEKIARLLPLVGNCPAVVLAVKSAGSFFSGLKSMGIRHPEVVLTLPLQGESCRYLYKMEGGCGGVHVMPASDKVHVKAGNGYYQQWIDGLPVSLLFLADGSDIRVVGFNEQLISPSPDTPFRYGGVVRGALISQDIQRQFIHAARQITAKFGLRGLNSLDAVVAKSSARGQVKAEQAELYVLEVNPRLSASLDLYGEINSWLIEQHILLGKKSAAFNSCDTIPLNLCSSLYHAQAIVYADIAFSYDGRLAWPSWVKDNPLAQSEVYVQKAEPICSVNASGVSLQEVRHLLQHRVQWIKNLLQNNSDNASIFGKG